jgi:TRAP-type C4-dicarboxylate transport system permease small subunit
MNGEVAGQAVEKRLGRWFDWCIERALAVVFIGFTLLSFAQVIARYAFGHPITWTEELSRYLFVWVVFVGAGVAERDQAHITLDFLISRFPPRLNYWLGLVNGFLCIAMVLILFVWYGWSLTLVSMRQQSPFGGPPVGFATLAIPVGGLLMVVNTLRAALRARPQEAKP